ncbi:MAG: hypothetical protein CL897_06630 [Dehalococcoidia bacterium]|nr:hypothetical protein [Dehalococcoidia bacterium]HCU99882.1 hypothetical protein [Dehalococcoidia bacterium]
MVVTKTLHKDLNGISKGLTQAAAMTLMRVRQPNGLNSRNDGSVVVQRHHGGATLKKGRDTRQGEHW